MTRTLKSARNSEVTQDESSRLLGQETFPAPTTEAAPRPSVSLEFFREYLSQNNIPFYVEGTSISSPLFFGRHLTAGPSLRLKIEDAWDTFFTGVAPTLALERTFDDASTFSVRLLNVHNIPDLEFALRLLREADSFLEQVGATDQLRVREIDVISRGPDLARVVFASADFRLFRVYLNGNEPVIEQLRALWVEDNPNERSVTPPPRPGE